MPTQRDVDNLKRQAIFDNYQHACKIDRLLAAVEIMRKRLTEIRNAQLIPGLYHGGETYYGMSERMKGIAVEAMMQADKILEGNG